MTKEQLADSQTYGVLNVFINENTAKCQESEILSEDVVNFQDVWAEFNNKKEEAQKGTTSIAANNAKLKTSLSAQASDVFKYLQSHGIRKKDQTLLDIPKPAKTKMMAFLTVETDDKGKLVLKKPLPADKNAPIPTFNTDANGKLVVKTGNLKELIFKVSKDLFEDQEVKVTEIKRGKVTEIEVRMKRATAAVNMG